MEHPPIKKFAEKIEYELKRAERYRVFLSLLVFNIGPIVDLTTPQNRNEEGIDKGKIIDELSRVIRSSTREIDFVSNSGQPKIGVLLPETSRQGAEAAAHRIAESINGFCSDRFQHEADYMVPIEISSFPDAAGARSISSYMEEFKK